MRTNAKTTTSANTNVRTVQEVTIAYAQPATIWERMATLAMTSMSARNLGQTAALNMRASTREEHSSACMYLVQQDISEMRSRALAGCPVPTNTAVAVTERMW